MTDKTVLLACELGGGMGHVDPLLQLARGLAEFGARPVLASRNLCLVWPKVRETPFPLMQAPVFYWGQQGPQGKGAGFDDTLARTGWLSEDTLLPMIRGWEHILDLLRPSLIIADYSPILCLTVYRSIPILNVGFGFILPPTDKSTFPPLLPGRPPIVAPERLLGVIQAVQRTRGRPVPETLTGVFAAAEPYLTVLPEVDHYHEVRKEGHVGPMVELLPPQPFPENPRFFAYLKATNSGTETIVNALAQTGFPGQVYVLGADETMRVRLARPGVEILAAPLPLNEILPHVSVVIHHGGINVAQQALAAGRTQLVFPEHLESNLTAARLHQLGVAHYMKDNLQPRLIVPGVRELATSPAFRDRARALAESIHSRGPWNPLPKILARCRELLA